MTITEKNNAKLTPLVVALVVALVVGLDMERSHSLDSLSRLRNRRNKLIAHCVWNK